MEPSMIQYLVSLACPNCQHKLRIKHEYLGRMLRCKYCAHEFQSPTPSNGAPQESSGRHDTEGGKQASQQRIAVLEAELQAVREELLARAAQHTAAVETLQQTQGELSRLQDQVKQAQTPPSDTAEWTQKLSAAQAEIEQLRTQVEKLQVQGTQKPAAATVGRESTPLIERAQHIRSQLEAKAAIQEQMGRMNAELAAARVEQARLTAELQTVAAEAAELRAKGLELERSVSDWTTAHTELSQALHQGKEQWETERQTLHQDWEARFQAQFREAEQRLLEEKTRSEGDRRQLHEQLDAIRQAHEQEMASFRSEVEQLQQEITSVRGERDASTKQVQDLSTERSQLQQDMTTLREEREASTTQIQMLGEERKRLTAERDELDARYKETVERFRADFARLTEAWQQSRQQETAAAEQNRALTEQIEKLNAGLAQQRNRETEQQQMIAALQQMVDTLHAESVAERECHHNALSEEKASAAAERQKWQEEKQAAEARFEEENNALRSEVEQVRGELAVFQHALEIVGVVGE
jgi:chromosome segregation ATPase